MKAYLGHHGKHVHFSKILLYCQTMADFWYLQLGCCTLIAADGFGDSVFYLFIKKSEKLRQKFSFLFCSKTCFIIARLHFWSRDSINHT